MLKGKSKGNKIGLIAIIGGAAIIVCIVALKFLVPATVPAKKPSGGAPNPPASGGGGNTGGGANNNTSSGGGGNTTSSSGSGFPLAIGSKGQLVTQLQYILEGFGHPLTTDGIFGSQTQAALIAVSGKATVDSQAEFNNLYNSQPSLQGAPALCANALTNQEGLQGIQGGCQVGSTVFQF